MNRPMLSSRAYRFLLMAVIIGTPAMVGLEGCSKKKESPQGMVFIPAGEFIMGTNKVDTEGAGAEFGTIKPFYLDEHPQHKVHLDAYYMDIYEVSNIQYKEFVDATGSRPPQHWEGGVILQGREEYPVAYANWYDADRYCRWKDKRLPTEAEWEKAARGTDGRDYPWGNEFDPTKANTGDTGIGDLAPVGHFKAGISPYGVYDMSGNVWEWTADWYKSYPGAEYLSQDYGEKYKILRGSSWGGIGHYAIPYFYRTSYRFYISPEEGYPDAGFRCVKDTN